MTAAQTLASTIDALRAEFGSAILYDTVSCGDTIVGVDASRLHAVLAWLKETPGQDFNYLTDITAVDYRDPEHPLELVYQVASWISGSRFRSTRTAR